jgi:hypothetical protein
MRILIKCTFSPQYNIDETSFRGRANTRKFVVHRRAAKPEMCRQQERNMPLIACRLRHLLPRPVPAAQITIRTTSACRQRDMEDTQPEISCKERKEKTNA